MSATRLLVLGAVRIMQPVHGYDVRRELISWRLEELANVKTGSIYGALRTLAKDGCIAVKTRESDQSRPERTVYVLTAEGEKEFQRLLRESWWTVTSGTEPLIPAMGLMPFMPREEIIRALQARLGRLKGELDSTMFTRRSIRDGATGADGEIPEHVREVLDFVTAKLRAEISWTRQLQHRLRDGAYRFVGEQGLPDLAGKGSARDGNN
ncbi:MAG: PadR family transcriptional regulator [bacterium]